jgi:hypothetical protein
MKIKIFADLLWGFAFGFLRLAFCTMSRAERSKFMQEIFTRVQGLAEQGRPRAVENGRAQMALQLDELIAKIAASFPVGSTWTFHKDQWGPHEVVVMPRVIDSNTGVITGPPDNPDRGQVVTIDGQMPNCEPPALNQILYGNNMPPAPGAAQ